MKRLNGLSRSQILRLREMAGDEQQSNIYIDEGKCQGNEFSRPHIETAEGVNRVVIGMDWWNVYITGWDDCYKTFL